MMLVELGHPEPLYLPVQRTGDELEFAMPDDKTTPRWAPVPGYEGIYVASTDGRVRSTPGGRRSGLPLVPHFTNSGYAVVSLWKDGGRRRETVHSLVLAAFVAPRPPGGECRHLNGDSRDNRLTNLKWGTRKENFEDMRRHGTTNAGSRHGMAKLVEADVRKIRARAAGGERLSDIAGDFPVSAKHLGDIVRRKRWGHI